MSKNVKNSVILANDVMFSIKNLAKEMNDQVNLNKKVEIHKKAENVLSKLQQQSQQQHKRDSILDLDLLSLNTNLYHNNNNKNKQNSKDKIVPSKNSNSKVNSFKKNYSNNYNNNNNHEYNNNEFREEMSQTSKNESSFSNNNLYSDPFKTKKSFNSKLNKGFYEKQLEYLSQHELKMNHMRKEKIDNERSTMKECPGMSKKSIVIMKNKHRISTSMTHCEFPNKTNRTKTDTNEDIKINIPQSQMISTHSVPFYLRSKEIQKEQEERKEQLKQLYIMINQQNDEKILAKSKKSNKPFNQEEFDKWIDNKQNWKIKKRENEEKMKKDKANKIDTKECYFQPSLNNKSMRIVDEKYSNSSFHLRNEYYKDYKLNNKFKIENEITPAFNPNINKDLPKYVRKDMVEIYKMKKSSSTGNIGNSEIKNIIQDISGTNNKEIGETSLMNATTNKNTFTKKTNDSNINVISDNEEAKKDNFYNLNVRDNAAWDDNKENFVVLNSVKYTDILSKLALENKNEPRRSKARRSSAKPYNNGLAWK